VRLDRLDLLAFGPFTDATLDLAVPATGVHVVYGPNEAGKSTALRAVGALLFGFPHQSPDAHLHPASRLRVAGRLRREDEEVLEVVRRKGRKNTLLTPEGDPFPDDALQAALGGASREVFETMFGLDHETLRRGAEALLEGRGDVGESLYEAALGGRGIHALLSRLRAEADALYRPRARRARIPAALDELRAAERRARDAQVAAEAVERQRGELADAEARRAELAAEIRRLTLTREHKARLKAAFPHARRLERATRERRALGDVLPVAPDAGERRQAIEQRVDEARRQAKLRAADLARVAERLDEAPAPSRLAALSPQDLDGLEGRLAAERNHRAAHPGLVAVVGEQRRRLDEGLRQMGLAGAVPSKDEPAPASPGSDTPIAGLRQVAADRSRIKRLAREGADALRRRDASTADARQLAQQRARAEEAARDRAPAPDPEPLALALAELGAGPLPSDRLIEVVAARRDLDEPIAALLRRLGRPDDDPAALAAAPVPSPIDVENRRREAEDAVRELARQDDAIAATGAELDRVDAELAALASVGEVPSEDGLRAARQRRDEALERLRFLVQSRGLGPGRDDLAAIDGLAANVSRVDDLADRLRRETARVERAAALETQRRQLRAQGDLLGRRRAARQRTEDEAQAAWADAWGRVGVAARDPEAMADWLRAHDELAARVGERARLAEDEAGLRDRVGRLAARFGERLREAGADPALAGDALPALVAAARARVDELAEARRRAAAEDAALAELRERADRVEADRQDAEARVARWRESWGRAVAPLGCGTDADPEDVLDRLDQASELVRLADELEDRDARRAAVEAEMAAFAADVARLPAELGVDPPPGASAQERCQGLLSAARQARKDADERSALEAELARRRDEVAALEAQGTVAADELAALFREAGVPDRNTFLDAEHRAAAARDLDAEAETARRALVDAADGEAPEPLLGELAGVEIEALRADLEALGRDLEELGEERADLDQRLGSLRNGLRELVSRGGGAAAAEEAAAQAATTARAVDRYVELFVAIRVLEAEIERYRAEHQGPLVEEASALFPRLTLGRYAGLSVAFAADDRPVLRAVRADGETLDVDALSDGTRDQLYLALRLATLERWVAGGREPLPFVLDDTFVHFDAERSRAALEVLGELAPRFQTLLFTHHDRMVELAREAIPPDRLRVHVLERRDLDALRSDRRPSRGA